MNLLELNNLENFWSVLESGIISLLLYFLLRKIKFYIARRSKVNLFTFKKNKKTDNFNENYILDLIKINLETNKLLKDFIMNTYLGTKAEKEDFLKELEIIVNAYEDIYNDNEVQKMFEDFKENF